LLDGAGLVFTVLDGAALVSCAALGWGAL